MFCLIHNFSIHTKALDGKIALKTVVLILDLSNLGVTKIILMWEKQVFSFFVKIRYNFWLSLQVISPTSKKATSLPISFFYRKYKNQL